MFVKQFYLGCLSHASYLIADEGTGEAVVIDPQRDVDQYKQEAERRGFSIKHVILTHVHADFVPGHLELAHQLESKIYLGAAADAQFEHVVATDNMLIELGRLSLRILETPGHTPDSICVLLEEDGHPRAVFTGDTLFIGDVGRPDLLVAAGSSAEELARKLYHSLHTKLMVLPDDVVVYPAHGAGSMCGKNLSKDTSSTIGEQKLTNYALRQPTEDAFVQAVIADQLAVPKYFAMNASLNRQNRSVLDHYLTDALQPLSLPAVLDLAAAGAQLLDVRSPGEFCQGFLKGSINVGLSGNFATWCGSILDHSQPIVLIVPPGKEEEAVMRLARIGFDNVVGYVEGGFSAFQKEADLLESIKRVEAAALQQLLAATPDMKILDVRSPAEWLDFHIPESFNIPLNVLAERINELSLDSSLAIHCLGGYRSVIGASILKHYGINNLVDLKGGINAWAEAGLDTESGSKTPAGCQ